MARHSNLNSQSDNPTTEAWNVADGFTKYKILKILIDLDKYEEMAKFGTIGVEADIPLEQNEIAKRRVEGIQRMLFSLSQLIGNVKFALKSKDRSDVDAFEERLDNVEKVIHAVFDKKENMITKEDEIIINENHFGLCLSILKQIKDYMNIPLNHANLIFKEGEEIDLDKISTEFVFGG